MLAPLVLAASGLFFAKSAAVTVTSSPPSIDGRLDDEVWRTATAVEGFTNFEPIEAEPMTQRTVVRLARDERNLYVAFECHDSEPAKVRATFADRDAIFNDDWVMLVLDPFEDERRGVLLLANPYGIQADLTHDDSNGGNEDATWDALWFSAGQRTPEGFVVEMAIPFASLRFDPAHDGWGFNVVRRIARNGHKGSWAPIRSAEGPLLHQNAELTGMRGLSQGITAGLIPELTLRGGPAIDAGNSLARTRPGEGPWGGRGAGDVGVTGRLSRAGTALDVTVHPDFSQVESDPARLQVNQRFALFLDEKRPFFLEGRSAFLTPETIVYTRTIVDPIFGLKLTGKQGPTAFAILNAVDQDPENSTIDPRWNRTAYGDNQAVTTAVRLATDVADGTTMGIVATDKHVGNAWNRVAGIDTNFARGSVNVQGQALWSSTDHPTKEIASGDAQRLNVAYFTRHLGSYSYIENVSSDFRAEAGFLPRAGFVNADSDLYYRWETGWKTGLHAWRLGMTLDAVDSLIDSDETRDANGRVRFEFPSLSIWLYGSAGTERYADTAFDSKTRTGFQVQGSPSRWITFNLRADAGDEVYYDPDAPYLGRSSTVNVTATLQPLDRWSVALGYDRKAFVTDDVGAAVSEMATRGEESRVFDASVANVTTQFFFTSATSARVFARYDDESAKVSYSALLSWRPSPGTVTYLGYQDSTPTRADVEASDDDRAVFFKLSWFFRY